MSDKRYFTWEDWCRADAPRRASRLAAAGWLPRRLYRTPGAQGPIGSWFAEAQRQHQRDHVYLDMARAQARLSKDPRHQVGCIILDADGRTLPSGYNGFAPGVPETPELLANEDDRLALTLHAEMNALLRAGDRAAGGTIYITKFPCPSCAGMIVTQKIKRVVIPEGSEASLAEDWKRKVELVKYQFKHSKCGEVVLVEV